MYRWELRMCTHTMFAFMGKRRASIVCTTGKRNIATTQHIYKGEQLSTAVETHIVTGDVLYIVETIHCSSI